MRERKVQVSEKFYEDALGAAYELTRFLQYENYELDVAYLREVAVRLIAEDEARKEARARRDKYTAYKTSPAGSPERERHRRDYLDEVGIPGKFRSAVEVPEKPPPH